MSTPVFLTLEEAAKVMRRGQRSVLRYLADGSLVGSRPSGGGWLITPAAIEAWAAAGQSPVSLAEPIPVRALREYRRRSA